MIVRVPQSWERRKLGEIAYLLAGGTPKRSVDEYFGGNIDWVTPTDLGSKGGVSELGRVRDTLTEKGLKNCSAKLLPPGTVLFSSRASIGKVAVTNRYCATNQGFINFIPKDGVIDSWFLAYYLAYLTPQIEQLAGETTYKEVSRGKIKHFEIPIPQIIEQRRIVKRIKECLSRLDEIKRLREETLQEAEAIFISKVFELFSCGWMDEPVGALCIEGPNNGIFKKRNDFGSGVLLVNVKDLYIDDVIQIHHLERVRASQKEVSKYGLQPGDVLVNRSSLKREGLGRSCMYEGYSEPVLFECHIMRIRIDIQRLHPYLFTAIMNSRLGWQRILERAKTSTMTTWNQEDLRSIKIPVPPIGVQEKIVTELLRIKDLSKKIKSEIIQSRSEIERSEAAILRNAFAGEL